MTVTVDTPPFNPSSGQNTDTVLEIFDADLGRIAFADSADPWADESAEVLVQPGTWYIKIHNYNGSAGGVYYDPHWRWFGISYRDRRLDS